MVSQRWETRIFPGLSWAYPSPAYMPGHLDFLEYVISYKSPLWTSNFLVLVNLLAGTGITALGSCDIKQLLLIVFYKSLRRVSSELHTDSTQSSAARLLFSRYSGCEAVCFQGYPRVLERWMGIGQIKTSQYLLFKPRLSSFSWITLFWSLQAFGYFPEFWKSNFWLFLQVFLLL